MDFELGIYDLLLWQDQQKPLNVNRIKTNLGRKHVSLDVSQVLDFRAGPVADQVGEDPADFDQSERRSDFVDLFLWTKKLIEYNLNSRLYHEH